MKGTIRVYRPKIFDTKLLLLTGAGASKPLSMPLMREFHDLVNIRGDAEQRELLRYVFLQHVEEKQGETLDLEALLALIERYRGFYDILFGDERFGYQISSEEWKQRARLDVEGLTTQDGPHTAPASADYLQHAFCRKEVLESLDTLLRNLMFEVYGKDLDASKLDELYSPLLKVIGRHFPQDFIPIFTTNYDAAVETYARQSNIQLETGFEPTYTGNLWEPSRFNQFEPIADKQNIVLFKLHGSLTWHRKDNNIVSTGLPIRDPSGYKSVVIYPTQTKEFPDEEPFRTMYNFLKDCFSVVKLAIVVGYSFRDTGIQRIMDDALEHNPNLRFVLVCGPNVDRWKKFAQQNSQRYKIIPHYFGSVLSGGEYLEELDAALAET